MNRKNNVRDSMDKFVNVGKNGSVPKDKNMRWLCADTARRQSEEELKRMMMKRRLAERDAEYAREFPDLVRRKKMAHDVMNDEMAELRRRFVG